MTIKQILDEIAAEGGSNMKMEILRKYSDDLILRRVLWLANSRRVKFYIKQIPAYEPAPQSLVTLHEAIQGLEVLRNRVVTGHDALAHLSELLSDLDVADGTVIKRIIDKDLKIGMNSVMINKVIPGLIEETPYMGAKSYDLKYAKDILKKGSAISQLKMDGRYCNAIIRHGEVELESRQGETTYLTGATFIEELANLPDCVLNGELTMDSINGNEPVSRYVSNGIISSLISILGKVNKGENVVKEREKFFHEYNMSPEFALSKIRYTVWDMITVEEYFAFKSTVQYHQRLKNLEYYLEENPCSLVSIVEGKYVDSLESAMSHFQSVLQRGEEGTILKSLDSSWKNGKPAFQIKMKLSMTFDLRIIGFQYGTKGTKNENVISTLICESEDGLLKTNPSGMTESMMKFVTENQDRLLMSVVECESSGISQNKDGEYSMLHPRVIKLRDDKNTCDTLESIKSIEKMAKGLA
jgi:ATP-dependent DNA ligase